VSDYLTDEEQMARLKSWWDENGRMLIAAVVVGITAVAGWRWYDSTHSEDVAAASNLYADFMDAEGDAKLKFAEDLAAKYPDSSYNALVLMQRAQRSVDEQELETAVTELQAALDIADTAELQDLIRLRLARVLQQQDQSDAALQVLAAVRSEGFRPQVAELKGDIHLSRGERALAHEAYQSALENLQGGTQRPLLELKAADTADAADA
jgi:predicted negative regulator of RcsB-dependent stress response